MVDGYGNDMCISHIDCSIGTIYPKNIIKGEYMPRKKKTTKTDAILSAFNKVDDEMKYPIVDAFTIIGLVALMVIMIYFI